jgi:hypothetical protein
MCLWVHPKEWNNLYGKSFNEKDDAILQQLQQGYDD